MFFLLLADYVTGMHGVSFTAPPVVDAEEYLTDGAASTCVSATFKNYYNGIKIDFRQNMTGQVCKTINQSINQ